MQRENQIQIRNVVLFSISCFKNMQGGNEISSNLWTNVMAVPKHVALRNGVQVPVIGLGMPHQRILKPIKSHSKESPNKKVSRVSRTVVWNVPSQCDFDERQNIMQTIHDCWEKLFWWTLYRDGQTRGQWPFGSAGKRAMMIINTASILFYKVLGRQDLPRLRHSCGLNFAFTSLI